MNDLLLINDLFLFIKAINYRIKKVKNLTIFITKNIFKLKSQYLNFNLYRDYKFHKLDKVKFKKNE
jgi:hypothetical protein